MGKNETNPKILGILMKKGDCSKNAIQSRITRLKNKHYLSNNACAELIARDFGISIAKHLSPEEKAELRDKDIVKKPRIEINSKQKTKKKIVEFIKYETSSPLLKKHIEEVNRAYTYKCYTSAFIVCRKVIENLIFQVLKKKCNRNEKNLYVMNGKGRIHDLKILLENIKNIIAKRVDPDEKQLLQRIVQKSTRFKDEANDNTHSLYHMASKLELDNAEPQLILDLIKEEFENYIS